MRIHVSHRTVYRYERPATGVIQLLRLTPRNHDGQYVVRWAIDVSDDCRLDQFEDAFGNIAHTFTADGPFTTLRVSVEGEIETQDTQGIIAGAVERLPPSLFLRETPLTQSNRAIAEFAATARDAAGGDVLKLLHNMVTRLHDDIVFDTSPTESTTTAVEAFALKRGVCQDFSHIFVAAARSLGIPARYIGGYFHRNDGVVDQEAGHQRHLHHRRPCPRRHGPRLPRRGAGARNALRRRRRDACGRGARRAGRLAVAKLNRPKRQRPLSEGPPHGYKL
jgi:transglutaminase-like putative cysteine protease